MKLTGDAARERLQEIITKQAASAQAVVRKVLAEVPEDAIVRPRGLRYSLGEDTGAAPPLTVAWEGSSPRTLHPNAFAQVAERSGVPTAYAAKLRDGQRWEREMLRGMLATTAEHNADRWLTRSIGGQVRGVLSDRFRRIDARPLMDTFVAEVGRVGAVPCGGIATDVQVSLKAVLPRAIEIAPGEHVALGIDWSTSDYGRGKLSIRSYLLRLICMNGATMQDTLGEVHLGGRLADSIAFSQRTLDLDTKTTASAMRDAIHGVLGAGAIEQQVDLLKRANEQTIDWAHVRASIAKVLSKEALAKAEESFAGPDVVNLPPEPTVWRASNALSWLAHSVDGEARIDLERLAGQVLLTGGASATPRRTRKAAAAIVAA